LDLPTGAGKETVTTDGLRTVNVAFVLTMPVAKTSFVTDTLY